MSHLYKNSITLFGIGLLICTQNVSAIVIDSFDIPSSPISVPGDFSRVINATNIGSYDRALHVTAGRGNTGPDGTRTNSTNQAYPGSDNVEGGVNSGYAYMNNYNNDPGAALRGYTTIIYGTDLVGNEASLSSYFNPGNSVIFDAVSEGSTRFEVDVAYADFNTNNNTLAMMVCDMDRCWMVSGYARGGTTFNFTYGNWNTPYMVGTSLIRPALDLSEITRIALRMDGEFFQPLTGDPTQGPLYSSSPGLLPTDFDCPTCSASMILSEIHTDVIPDPEPEGELPVPTPLVLIGLGLAAMGYTRRK